MLAPCVARLCRPLHACAAPCAAFASDGPCVSQQMTHLRPCSRFLPTVRYAAAVYLHISPNGLHNVSEKKADKNVTCALVFAFRSAIILRCVHVMMCITNAVALMLQRCAS